jgi:hypothetical protein
VDLAFAVAAAFKRLTIELVDHERERHHLFGSEAVVVDHDAAARRDKAELTRPGRDVVGVMNGSQTAAAVGGGGIVADVARAVRDVDAWPPSPVVFTRYEPIVVDDPGSVADERTREKELVADALGAGRKGIGVASGVGGRSLGRPVLGLDTSGDCRPGEWRPVVVGGVVCEPHGVLPFRVARAGDSTKRRRCGKRHAQECLSGDPGGDNAVRCNRAANGADDRTGD